MFWPHSRSPKWFCDQDDVSQWFCPALTKTILSARREGRKRSVWFHLGQGAAEEPRPAASCSSSIYLPSALRSGKVSVFWSCWGEHTSVCHNSIENLWFCLKISPNPLNQKVRLWCKAATTWDCDLLKELLKFLVRFPECLVLIWRSSEWGLTSSHLSLIMTIQQMSFITVPSVYFLSISSILISSSLGHAAKFSYKCVMQGFHTKTKVELLVKKYCILCIWYYILTSIG